MALSKAFFAPSIYWAKTLTASITSNMKESNELFSSLFGELIKFWGEEFCREERILPYEFGGWAQFSCNHLNYALIYLEEEC